MKQYTLKETLMNNYTNLNDKDQDGFWKKLLNANILFYWKENFKLTFKDSLSCVGVTEMTLTSIINPLIYLIFNYICYIYFFRLKNTWNELYQIVLSAITVFIIYFLIRLLFFTPFKLYDKEKQKNNNQLNKESFIINIRPIMEQASLLDPLNKDAPRYNDALIILTDNAAISKVWIDIFMNDESLRTRYDSMYSPTELRLRLLNEIINSLVP